MKLNKSEIRKVFASNTEKTELHITSDGHKFWERNHAVTHANTLEDKSVTTTTKDEALLDESDEDALATVIARKKALQEEIEKYKPEWEELDAKQAELEEKIEASKTAPSTKDEEEEEEEDNSGASGTDKDPPVTDPGAGDNASTAGKGKPSGKNANKNAKK